MKTPCKNMKKKRNPEDNQFTSSFYTYNPSSTESNKILEDIVKNFDLKNFNDFEKESKKSPDIFSFKKMRKLYSNEKIINIEKINFKNGEKNISFKKYIDSEIGLNLRKIFKNKRDINNIKDISNREEDFSSGDEEIKKGVAQCVKDLEDGINELTNGNFDMLFYLNEETSKLKYDTNFGDVKKSILDTPETESLSSVEFND